MSGTQNKLLLVLERSIAAIGEAKVIVIDARRLNTDHPAKEWYHQLGVPLPMTRVKYYFWNPTGIVHARVESVCSVQGTNLTTLGIINPDGIWHVMPQWAAEISSIFSRDQLYDLFPFSRLFATVKYPYELSVDESDGSLERIAVKGRLLAKPPECVEDIAI